LFCHVCKELHLFLVDLLGCANKLLGTTSDSVQELNKSLFGFVVKSHVSVDSSDVVTDNLVSVGELNCSITEVTLGIK